MKKFNWKRIAIAAIWSELLLLVVYVPVVLCNFHAIPMPIITVICMLVFMFCGGFWAVRRSESHFFVQGLIVGFIANILFYIVAPLMLPDATWWDGILQLIISFFHPIKVLAGGFGGYVYGRKQKKIISQLSNKKNC